MEKQQPIKENSGPNSVVGANLFKGNFAYSFTPFKHAIKGFSTYATLTYNSLNDQSTIMGKDWSLDTNSMMRYWCTHEQCCSD
ncbi:hypothetical protein J2Z48_001783 [Croceifilum oryzae]|uniref:Uncharacterized protein n=1 Tax=Croceifilum oryzae TaxID=1553429 RepID=A0AAJ1WSE1_9BACL|nr:hypothetical protein [Croceifilum oryzae]